MSVAAHNFLKKVGTTMSGNSNLHQSPGWEKAHVDIGRDHGHSPTLNPPRELDGVKEVGGWKDIPAPYGPTRGFPNDDCKK